MSLCELGCPSLEYVYDMTWAEFLIRLHGYNRISEKTDFLFREVAWASLMGSHLNPKKLPKTKQKFWHIGKGKPKGGITDKMKARISEAVNIYNKQKQNARK